jgi:hypothetical protein
MKSMVLILTGMFLSLSLFPVEADAQAKLNVGGYMQTWLVLNEHQERAGDDYDTWGFRIRRARLTAQADITDVYSVTTWLEFAGPQANLLDFFVAGKFSTLFNLRVGQFRPPAQTYDTGILSSARLIFYERPLITTRLAGIMGYDAYRDIGAMVYGSTDKLWYGVYLGNGLGRFTHAGSNILSRDFSGGVYGGRFDFTPADGLTIGVHLAFNSQQNVVVGGGAPYDIDRLSYSVRLAADNLGFTEKIFTQFEYAGGNVDDTNEYDFNGWYLEAGYKLYPRFHLLARYDTYRETYSVGTDSDADNVTVGIIHYHMHEGKELIRSGINYSFGQSNPGSLNRHAFILWFQIRFIP